MATELLGITVLVDHWTLVRADVGARFLGAAASVTAATFGLVAIAPRIAEVAATPADRGRPASSSRHLPRLPRERVRPKSPFLGQSRLEGRLPQGRTFGPCGHARLRAG